MKLQILVPHYNEPFEIIKPLLDSIAIQQNVDLANEVGVIICNDGDDYIIDKANFTNYPFNIDYYFCEHRGVSATRNSCLDKATSDYIMFCDCDDMFSNVCALWVIFREMDAKDQEGKVVGFDGLVSVFIQESRIGDQVTYINRGDKDKDGLDSTFVHGKIYRRQYLLDNKIRWCEKLTIHEDSYFNCLCETLSKNIKYISNPFYLWKWRDNSICRGDEKYILKTFTNLIDSSDALVEQFLLRKRVENAQYNVTYMTFNTYYTLNKEDWLNPDNKQYRDKTEQHFKKYFNKYKYLYDNTSQQIKNQIIQKLKNSFYSKGLFIETITFNDWIKHIEEL